MDVIDDLIEKRKDLFKQVQAIDTVLKIYGYKAEDYNFDSSDNTVNELSNPKVFPTKTRLDKQILWIFENSLTRGLKLTEFQKIFNEHIGNDGIKIENKARHMKKDGKLVLVKYNSKHIHSFWGLPSWIEGNDFAPAHKPNEEQLPEITNSEVIRE